MSKKDEFLEKAILTELGESNFPITLQATVTITGIKFLNEVEINFGQFQPVNKKLEAVASLPEINWSNIRLVDNREQLWETTDNGQVWENGGRKFVLKGNE